MLMSNCLKLVTHKKRNYRALNLLGNNISFLKIDSWVLGSGFFLIGIPNYDVRIKEVCLKFIFKDQ